MGKKLGSGSGMSNPNHILESLETIFLGFKSLNTLSYPQRCGLVKSTQRMPEQESTRGPAAICLVAGSRV